MERKISVTDYGKSLHGLLWFVAHAWASVLHPFTRYNSGVEYFGLQAGIGWVILFLFGLAGQP